MRVKILLKVSVLILILFLHGCVSLIPTLKFSDIRTIPDGASVEVKITYISEVNPNYKEEQAYSYLGETPLIGKWSYHERVAGTHYISIRINKPGFYPFERTYRAVDIPDTIELELEKIR